MSNIADKTKSNVFYQARYSASTHNEQLSSRDVASDIMSIDRGRLYRIESGLINPYPEEIHLMADLYNAPELVNFYCTGICPLGKNIPKVELETLDRISIKALTAFRKISSTKDDLLNIVEDGVISENEKPELEKILETLDEVSHVAQNLRIWVEKNLR